MSSRVKDLVIRVIAEGKVKDEIGWLEKWCEEEAVSTFLIKHPEVIAKGLELAGMQVNYRLKRFDLLFRKDRTYFIVEVKRGYPITKALKKKVVEYANNFETLIDRETQQCESIVPVLVTTN